MTRTTFYFPDPLLSRLRSESGRTGASVSEILRRAAGEYLAARETQAAPAQACTCYATASGPDYCLMHAA
jgi:hypothetical protein